MRILVYGAGVLGSYLAHILRKTDNNVTLLARVKWKECLEQKGLRIKHFGKPGITVDHPKIIDKLAPNDVYVMIFVVMHVMEI